MRKAEEIAVEVKAYNNLAFETGRFVACLTRASYARSSRTILIRHIYAPIDFGQWVRGMRGRVDSSPADIFSLQSRYNK
uniref:Uncharacterized protein n=1 Tax=Heterorhabditis bacteriophora TaxID=37862 RepID=A0A1I7XLE2_HETBA